MRSLLLIALLCLNLTNALGHREETYYLHGMIDGKELAIQVDEFGEACLARYVIGNNKYDSILEGKILGNGKFDFLAYEWDKESNQKVATDSIFLEENEINKWNCTWKVKNGPTHIIKLSPIIIDSLNHPFVRTINKYNITPYLAFKTKDIRFETTKKKKIAKGTYIEHVKEPLSNLTWFRVISTSNNTHPLDSINDRLISIHLDAINSKYSCIYMGEEGHYSIGFNVDFLNDELISFSINTNSSCYGKAEHDIIIFNTLKLENAQPIVLEDLYWFGEQPIPQLIKGEYKWFQYRYNYFGPAILELLTKLYPKQIKPSKRNTCAYDNVKLWQFPDWHLTRKGLFLKPKSPILKEECREISWPVISFEALKQYATGNDFGL